MECVVPSRIPEPRVVTLSPNSVRLLTSLGVMDIAEKRCITPFHDMIVYEEVGKSYMRFNNSHHRDKSTLVKLEEDAIKKYAFNDESSRSAFEECQ